MKTHHAVFILISAFCCAGAMRGQTPALTSPQGKVTTPAGPIDIANEPIVRVVANVKPAVVNITAQGTVQEYSLVDPFFRQFRVRNAQEQSIGSGLLVSADGYIITNAHVVELAEKTVSVTLSTGSKYQAQIVTTDEDQDLALLKIEDKSVQFPYFDLSYVSPNILGETVIAFGSPEGYQNTVSHGILSAKDRTFTAQDHTYNNLVQTDAAINPGNSGGPLVDLNGSLVGINSAKLAGEAVENIGFAIPHEIVVPWAKDAMAVARGEKPAGPPSVSAVDILKEKFGLAVKALDPDAASDLDYNEPGGLIITEVEPDSPAAQQGLRKNMLIVGLNNRRVVDVKSLPHELQHVQTGDQVSFHVIFIQSAGPFRLQRGGVATLTAR